MTKITKLTKLTLIIVANLLGTIPLVGCHKASEGSESATLPAKTAADETRATGDPQGKRTAPIRIDYSIIGDLEPGRPLEIRLTVASDLPGPLQVRLLVDEGLAMGSAQEQVLLADAATPPMTENVVVVPQTEGRFYLSVHAFVDTPDGPQMRIIAIPIQVGDEPPAPSPDGTLKSAEGEPVISLPAKEDKGR